MPDQPYQFGDVVDGYRWTITGWEPVEAPERTVGVPRLLEKRYAATRQAQERQQTQTLEAEARVVVEDDPLVAVDPPMEPQAGAETRAVAEPEAVQPQPAPPAEPDSSHSLEQLLGGGRRVVAAPDLAIEYDADPARPEPLEALAAEVVAGAALADEHVDEVGDEDVAPQESAATAETAAAESEPVGVDTALLPGEDLPYDGSPVAEQLEAEGFAPQPEPYDARPAGMRAWYGLGIEPIEEPRPEPSPFDPAPVDDDEAFAAALAHGTRALAERYQPSEIEIAAGVASSAAVATAQPAGPPAFEPIDEWTSTGPDVVAPEPLDARELAYGSATLPDMSEPEEPAVEPEPRVITPTPPPPAGWYPGSV